MVQQHHVKIVVAEQALQLPPIASGVSRRDGQRKLGSRPRSPEPVAILDLKHLPRTEDRQIFLTEAYESLPRRKREQVQFMASREVLAQVKACLGRGMPHRGRRDMSSSHQNLHIVGLSYWKLRQFIRFIPEERTGRC